MFSQEDMEFLPIKMFCHEVKVLPGIIKVLPRYKGLAKDYKCFAKR